MKVPRWPALFCSVLLIELATTARAQSPKPQQPPQPEPIAPRVEKLSEEEIGQWVGQVQASKLLPKDIIVRGLISSHHTLRAECAMYLATHGGWTDVPHLIDALADESTHVGASYDHMGKHTTRYWANVALIAIAKNDYGFRWNDPRPERLKAIERWTQFWTGAQAAPRRPQPMPDVVRVELLFDGESDKPFYNAVLVHGVEAEMGQPFQTVVPLDAFRKDRILEWLQLQGFWERAAQRTQSPPRRGQRYLLRVTSGNLQVTEDLGWGLEMLQRVDSLSEVFEIQQANEQRLDAQTASPLAPLLSRLSGFRREWEASSE